MVALEISDKSQASTGSLGCSIWLACACVSASCLAVDIGWEVVTVDIGEVVTVDIGEVVTVDIGSEVVTVDIGWEAAATSLCAELFPAAAFLQLFGWQNCKLWTGSWFPALKSGVKIAHKHTFHTCFTGFSPASLQEVDKSGWTPAAPTSWTNIQHRLSWRKSWPSGAVKSSTCSSHILKFSNHPKKNDKVMAKILSNYLSTTIQIRYQPIPSHLDMPSDMPTDHPLSAARATPPNFLWDNLGDGTCSCSWFIYILAQKIPQK